MNPREAFKKRNPAITASELGDLIETEILDSQIKQKVQKIVLLGSFVKPEKKLDDNGISDIDIWIVVEDWERNEERTIPDVSKLGDCAFRLAKWGYVDVFKGDELYNDGEGRDPEHGHYKTIRNAERILIQLTEDDIDNFRNRPVDLQIGNIEQLEKFLDEDPYLTLKELASEETE